MIHFQNGSESQRNPRENLQEAEIVEAEIAEIVELS